MSRSVPRAVLNSRNKSHCQGPPGAFFWAAFFLSAAFSCQAAAPHSSFISYLIESAEAKIKKSPVAAEGYSDLAFALARRFRETEDPLYWKRAEEAIQSALKLDPRNFDARKARVLIRIQQGRYADAKEEAVALNKQTPDDNILYGYLADIALAQGDYGRAESLTQRMLDLRQVNGPGLQRAARVREVIGFPEGAVEFWTSALRLASAGDTEERAYLLTQLAGISRRLGKLDDASRYTAEALVLEPEYPAGLMEQSRIALDRGAPKDSLPPLDTRLGQGESLAAQYWKYRALRSAGTSTEADAAGKRFLQAARLASNKPGNEDALLIRYLTDNEMAPEAVKLGSGAVTRNLDLRTLDAYAMALLAAGQPAAAKEQMDRLLKWGVRDPQYFLHAAEIYRGNNDAESARKFLTQCIEVSGNSPYAALALKMLSSK